eukprot:CAMPEP_0175674584 /NCGR_PEP_ID=MMETSP0097-20121207/21790_1 /TAXON_ID=311494 /ORGANISM="Alexandrium monilatum, Strain CCMP3105" /LENGTH=824 /DNA_ID=CAMNT_0016981273 /DNA_START=21 /DNA_END=2495 /DNA_ORIENTATION=-
MARLSHFLGEDPLGGLVYGVVNWIVCVPSLVSYAHIVFTQGEFEDSMPQLVKLYFLSSAVMQLAMTLLSSITFCIGQVQDVGLIFLAGMVRSIVAWAQEDGLTPREVLATSLWQCATSTFLVGACMLAIGRLRWSQYVQLIPLPVVGGYLGYIGYFCWAAGLSIGSGKEVNGPTTMLKLADPCVRTKLVLLAGMTGTMLCVHFRIKHVLGMPAVLLALPALFFAGASALGISVEECREAGWLPRPQASAASAHGDTVLGLFDPGAVQWWYIPRQVVNVLGLVLMVSFGSSLDVAAIQAEMAGQKIDYDRELMTIGIGNLASGVVGGATGSYIFSQTIFSAKRGVRSRLNGLVVCLGELLLFLLPVDILQFLPNSYIGGIMCLFGIDIMGDWLLHSRALMARSEYALVWVSFGCTMWLASADTFGVIEGMALGTVAASLVFVGQYVGARDGWQAVPGRSSVVRPPRERRVLTAAYPSILAVSLNGFAFFGASLRVAQDIEAEAEQRAARFVCLDLGRLSGLDSTASDQMRLLALALERRGARVLFSSLRAESSRRLLEAHGVVGPGAGGGRPVFATLDQALQHCEEQLLCGHFSPSRRGGPGEQPLATLLLDYVDGFVSERRLAAASEAAAQRLAGHFQRLCLAPGQPLFRQHEPADAIFVIAAGSVLVSSHREWTANLSESSALLPSPAAPPIAALARQRSCDSEADREPATAPPIPPGDCPAGPGPLRPSAGGGCGLDAASAERVGVGGILGDTAYFARRKNGCDAVAEASGCVAHAITRDAMEGLELSDPALMVFLQKVLLRDLSQLYAQFMGPLQLAGGLG